MDASTSTASATSPSARNAKKRRRLSSTNRRKPRKRNRKKKSPKKRNPSKNPNHRPMLQARPSRLRLRSFFFPEAHCDARFHFPWWPFERAPFLSYPLPPQPPLLPESFECFRAISNHLRGDARENFHAGRRSDRRRHARHPRRKNRGRWRERGSPGGGSSDRRQRAASLSRLVRPDYTDGLAGNRRGQRHGRFVGDRRLQSGCGCGHGGGAIQRAHSRHARGGHHGGAGGPRERRIGLFRPGRRDWRTSFGHSPFRLDD